ncbi:MAG: methyltransferase domain-containing protein [Dehalococcoidia bacterium]|nr:methyltransferase domain-containing protein [Dehalococcoidia bacterium]
MIEQFYATKDDQALKIFAWAAGAATMRAAYYGLKLGMLRALAAAPGGLTVDELQAQCDVDPRYLQAWAKLAAAGELLTYDASNGRLRMAPHMDELLLDADDFQYAAGLVTNFAVESRLADHVEACMQDGEGIPFADYGREMVETIHAFSKAAYELFLPSVLLPELPELGRQLADGGTILELGCGAGAGLVALARAFPACTVTGLDPDPTSVALARERIAAAGLDEHVHAEEMRAEDLTSEDAFDFIYTQISLHEMDDALTVLTNAGRALKEDGVLLITEIRGAERIEDATGDYGTVLAHIDLFYEIPQALAKGGRGVGFFSADEIRRLATEAGLRGVRELTLDQPLYAAFAANK